MLRTNAGLTPTAALALTANLFESYLERSTVDVFTVQTGDRGTGFMTFHFDKAETLALTAEQVFGQLDRMNFAELGKQAFQAGFSGGGWQTANK